MKKIKIGKIYKHKQHGYKLRVLSLINEKKAKCYFVERVKTMNTLPEIFISNLEEID
jgi:hypothetical protein